MGGARSDYVMAKNNTLSHARVPVASARVYIHTSVFPLTRGRERGRERFRSALVSQERSLGLRGEATLALARPRETKALRERERRSLATSYGETERERGGDRKMADFLKKKIIEKLAK